MQEVAYISINIKVRCNALWHFPYINKMQKDLLSNFESKEKTKSLCLILVLLLLLKLSINLFVYYTPFTKVHLLFATSGIDRIVFICSLHVLPLIGSLLLFLRKKLGWSLLVIYLAASIATDMHTIIHQNMLFPLYYIVYTAFIAILLLSKKVRSELKISSLLLLFTLLMSPIIPTFLILVYG